MEHQALMRDLKNFKPAVTKKQRGYIERVIASHPDFLTYRTNAQAAKDSGLSVSIVSNVFLALRKRGWAIQGKVRVAPDKPTYLFTTRILAERALVPHMSPRAPRGQPRSADRSSPR